MPPSTSYQPAPLPQRHGDPVWQERFEWDAASNPVTEDSAPTPNGPGYVRHNRLLMFQDQRYAYDTLGRLSSKRISRHTEQEFSWNEENQLTEVRTGRNGSSQTVRFEYDALGRRIAKHNEFGSVYFIWEGLRLLQERHARRVTTHVYEPESYVPLARIDTSDALASTEAPPRIYWFHTNASGAPEELSDQEGRIHWRARYRAWGNLALQETPAVADDRSAQPQLGEQALRLQGQYFDSETGLCYNTFRYYDADCGRFVSQDPIGLLGGVNLYQYGPNPLGWIDPWGWSVTPLNQPGYTTYGLYHPGAADPYYVGHTSQTLRQRGDQHLTSSRMNAADEIRPLRENQTYTQAKGSEQAFREKFNTKGKFPGNVIEPINKLRTDSRGKSHYKNYKTAAKSIGINPRKRC